ncbi:uncharacterized protein METZ01_LOCUS289220, partial [marine metagenome]
VTSQSKIVIKSIFKNIGFLYRIGRSIYFYLLITNESFCKMKTYEDIAGDGGSNIVEQVQALGQKLRARLDRIKYKVALMSGKGGV